MGKGFEQESGVPLTSVHNQVINAYKSPTNTVVTAASKTTLTSCTQAMLVLPGKLKMSTNLFLNQEPFLSTTRGLFSSKTPLVTLSSEVWAFPDDDTYFRSLGAGNRSALYSYCLDISKAKGCFRECPTGKQGNCGASGGSNNNSGSNSGGGSYSMWSIGGGSPLGSSGGVGGAGGGDDDPSKNPNNFNSGPNDIPFLNDEEINLNGASVETLETLEALIRECPFSYVLPNNPSARGFTQIREETHSYPTELSDHTTDPPSTPAPLTHDPCLVTPAMPYSSNLTNTTGGYMGSSQEAPAVRMEQVSSSDSIPELIQMQKLMMVSSDGNTILSNGSNSWFPNQSTSATSGSTLLPNASTHNTTTLVPQQPSYQGTQHYHVPTVRPSHLLVAPQQKPAEQNSRKSIDFLTSDENNFDSVSADTPFAKDEINVYEYLGGDAELLRDVRFDDIVCPDNPSAGSFTQIREQTQSYRTEPSDRTTDPPSTPAPSTPGLWPVTPATPYTISNTTAGYRGQSQETPVVCVEQASSLSDGTLELLEFSKLIINNDGSMVLPNSNNRFPNHSASTLISGSNLLPNMSSSTATLEQQALYQETQHHHVSTERPSSLLVAPQQQPVEQSSSESIDFLTSEFATNHNHHIISVYVPPDTSGNKFEVGHHALQHIFTTQKQYEGVIKDNSLTELQVANQQPAQLCSMELGMQSRPILNFKMPKSCIPLSKWVLENHDVEERQLVVQQMANTLTTLFKEPNDLCFWGSAQLWVDTNTRVYLYIDYIKALAIQKEYAKTMLPSNPRIEDCKMLIEVYNTVLKSYLQRDLTWISPQLSNIFNMFEDLGQNPSKGVSNMALVARVLGNRRICQLQVNLMIGTSFACNVCCAEHENLSDALGVLSAVLPSGRWVVRHALDKSPVCVTEMAVKEANCSYIMIPADGSQRFPGALYIDSKQNVN